MYAFYSLLVFIFYTLFRRDAGEREAAGGDGRPPPPAALRSSPQVTRVGRALCTEPARGAQRTLKHEDVWTELTELDSSSGSDGGSSTEEEEEEDQDRLAWAGLGDATTPLTEFRSLKQEAAAKMILAEKESPSEKPAESPLLSVMSHLLAFLERYSRVQQLEEQAGEYRSRLRREESRRRKQLRGLRKAFRQRVRDKLGVIQSLEGIIAEQQGLLDRVREGAKLPSPCLLHPGATAGVHRLVESLSALQGERSRLAEEVSGLRQRAEEQEREAQRLARGFHHQIQALTQQIREREEELARLRIGTGVTDSEKRIHILSAENEALRQSLRIAQGLLQQLAAASTQPPAPLAQENEALRARVRRLEGRLWQEAEAPRGLEAEHLRGRKEEAAEHLWGLQRCPDPQESQPPRVQCVARTVEVDSAHALRALAAVEERNRALEEQLSRQAERCRQLTEQLRSSEEAAAGLRHKISAYEAEIAGLRQELLGEISRLEARKEEAVREATQCSQQHLQRLREQLAGVQQRLGAMQPLLRGVRSDYASLRGEVRGFADCYSAALGEARRQMCAALGEASRANRSLRERCRQEEQLRRKYQEQLLELKGNIRVLCRLKPLTPEEQQEGAGAAVEAGPVDDGCVRARHKGRERTFRLDKVFLPQATQEEVFRELEPLVASCLQGCSACIFAYGQTGSGKTHTMEGVPGDPGINQRALETLFREMEAKDGAWTFSVSLSMVEMYNEVLRDLLATDPQEKLDIKLNPDGSGQLHVPGLTTVEVHSLREIQKMLSVGKRNRATHATCMNERSSRSHVLLAVTVAGTELASGTKVTGKLNLVDLAGSERVWKSGAEGERLKEAQSINKSLLALGEVIQALRAGQPHVPFRNSKLTYLLQDSLGRGSRTVMLVQISPLEKNMGESICSLKFAQRVCKVELGPAARRIDSSAQHEL